MIPKNVKTRFEFFSGFGWKELSITLLGLGIGLILFFIFGLFTKSMARIILVALFGACGLMFSLQDPRTGKSLLKLLKDYRHFNSKPRRYVYRFGEGRIKN